jgi:hypothetical protein
MAEIPPVRVGFGGSQAARIGAAEFRILCSMEVPAILLMNTPLKGDPAYAYGELSTAIEMLAVGPGDIRERLHEAFADFHAITIKRQTGVKIAKRLVKLREDLANHLGRRDLH